MSSKLHIGGVMMVMLFGLMVSSGPSWVSADEQKKEGAGDLQERGVPPQGVIVQGNQLRAAPGYVLEKGANNQMMARQKAGGGGILTLGVNCGCVTGTGNCHPSISGGGQFPGQGGGAHTDVAVCVKSANGPCSGQCGWTWAPTKVAPR